MDYVQALFSFFIAPLFGTVVLGMLWSGRLGLADFWDCSAERFLPSACGMGEG